MKMQRPGRGFSLIEVAVASAIAGVIGVAAISTFAALNRQLAQLQRENVANDVAKSTIDALVSRLQSVGGGPVRPHMAIWVENAGDAARDAVFKPLLPRPRDTGRDAPDRITYATALSDRTTCTIKALTATSVTGEIGAQGCCLEQLFKGEAAVNAYLVSGTNHQQVAMLRPVACVSVTTPGPLAKINSAPAAPVASYTGGLIAVVDVKTLYLNEDRELREFVQEPFSLLALKNGDSKLVCSDVFDFQAQLGFDSNGDGRIQDTNSTGDEWAFNVPSENDTFVPADLRMAGVSVIVGEAQVIKQPSTVSIVGNTPMTRVNYFLRSATGRASFRNIFVFN